MEKTASLSHTQLFQDESAAIDSTLSLEYSDSNLVRNDELNAWSPDAGEWLRGLDREKYYLFQFSVEFCVSQISILPGSDYRVPAYFQC